MKKKIAILLIAGMLVLSTTACGSGFEENNDNSASESDNQNAPTETETDKDDRSILISTDEFVDNFSENSAGVATLDFVKDFSEDEYNIHEYQVAESTMSSGCIIDISYDSEDNVEQILLQSRPTDAFMYGYATWSILSFDPNADYEAILSELNIMEDGSQEDGTYDSSQEWGTLLFTQTGSICTLNIVLN